MRLEKLFFLGFFLVFGGFILLVAGSFGSSSTSTGAVVFIGPVPLIFGSGPYGSELALISLVASVAVILLTYMWLRGLRATRQDEPETS